MAPHLKTYWSSERMADRSARFGSFMAAWRKRCNWSQAVLSRWGRVCGFYAPAHGGMSQMETGKTKDPEMMLFAGLAEANRRLAVRDFSDVKERQLLDRLEQGVPVLDRDGNPWQTQDFINAFHFPHLASGEIWESSGLNLISGPELTNTELARVNDTLHEAFLSLARQVRPITTALNLATKMAPADHQDAFRDALSGAGYTLEGLQKLWDQEAGEWAPLVWAKSLQD